MNRREIYQSERMKGIISRPHEKAKSVLIVLHGVGANEMRLLEPAETIAPDSVIISLRAPIVFGSASFAWFHVQFTPQGPVHNWQEADQSFHLLEDEIKSISENLSIPLSDISLMGFSQGAIMTMGIALKSSLALNRYICFSGRTLPEFASYARDHGVAKGRKIYLAHGTQDDKLPVTLGRSSKDILQLAHADFKYNEFPGGHSIPNSLIENASEWFRDE